MASRQKRPAPRLYLVTETVGDAGSLARALGLAVAAGDVAAVLLRLPETGEPARFVRAVAPAVQDCGAALLLDGRVDLVRDGGVDGAHLTGLDAFRAALPSLKPAAIAGAGGLGTRHDAMVAAEAGADYVMFGEPDSTGRRLALPAVAERVAWWSEVFEVPCVGFAGALGEVTTLAQAGADFVALGEFVWKDAAGPAAAVASAAERLRCVELA